MFELREPQMFMYVADKQGAGQVCLLCGSMIIPRKIPLGELQRAANEMFRLNGGLRTRFVEREDGVYQEVKPFEEQTFEVKKFKDKDELDVWASGYATIPLTLDVRKEGKGLPDAAWQGEKPSKELVKNVIKHEAAMKLTRARYGMMRRKPACCEIILFEMPDSCGAIIKVHHIISDAWSAVLVANQFVKILNHEEPLAYDYEEYMQRETEYLGSERCKRDSKFFEDQLERLSERTWVWPEHYTSLEASRRTVTIDAGLTNDIREYAAAHGHTPYTLFLAAVCVYMSRKMQREQFYVGSLVLNRRGIKDYNTVGFFATPIPLLMDINHDASFADILDSVGKRSALGLRHVKGTGGQKNDAKNFAFLFDLWVSYQNASLEVDKSIECTQYYCNYTNDPTGFTVEDRDGTGQLKIHFDHNVKVSEADVDELFEVVLGVLKRGIEDDTRVVSEL